jgi:hypothetical protein
MQNSPQTAPCPPTAPKSRNLMIPRLPSSGAVLEGGFRAAHLSCACGSGQRSLIRSSLAPAHARFSQARRRGRCCFATFWPPPRHPTAKVAHASPLFVAPSADTTPFRASHRLIPRHPCPFPPAPLKPSVTPSKTALYSPHEVLSILSFAR